MVARNEKLVELLPNTIRGKINILKKLNDFLVVLALRYNINKIVKCERHIQIYEYDYFDVNNSSQRPVYTDISVNLAVLTNYRYGNHIDLPNEKLDDIHSICMNVGSIREYMIALLEKNNEVINNHNFNIIKKSLVKTNKMYLTLIDEILKENILGNFLKRQEVSKKIYNCQQLITIINSCHSLKSDTSVKNK